MKNNRQDIVPILDKGDESHRIYNRLVLEILFREGELGAWELAKKISEKGWQIKTLKKTESSTITQKIYSVLIRKEGRLPDLTTKQYIKLNERIKYELGIKGLAAILIKEPGIASQMSSYYTSEQVFLNKQDLSFSPFSIFTEDVKALEDVMKRIYTNPRFYSFFAEHVKAMIIRGTNLDSISEDNLMNMVFSGEVIAQRMATELLRKNPNIRKINMGRLLVQMFSEFERKLDEST